MNDTREARERKLALLTLDIMGYTKAVAAMPAVEVARFLDGYYHLVAGILARHGGRVVKFMGDGCFAVFDEERCADAVACALDLREGVAALQCAPFPGRAPAAGVSVHLAVVAEADLGPDRRYDVVGEGVNHLFRMGGGAGVRISEPVYRALPNERRGPWRKNKPPATYVLD